MLFNDDELLGIEDGTVTVTLVRTLGTTGAVDVDLELNLDHSDNTASSSDLGGALPVTVSFSDGQTEATVALNLMNDEVFDEGCEVAMLALFAGSGGVSVVETDVLRILIEDGNVSPYVQSITVGSDLVTPAAIHIVNGPATYTITVSVAVPVAATTPLDLVFIEDLSGSFGDDLDRLQALIPNLISSVQLENPDTYFGVSSFVDTPVSPFGVSGEWSYRTDQPLTPNSVLVQEVVDSLSIRFGSDFPESQLFALQMVSKRIDEVGWREGSRRIVVLATDAVSHESPDGENIGLTPNDGDGEFDGGDGAEAPPSRQQVKDALIEAGIVPIFLATAGSATSYYTTLVSFFGFGTVVGLDRDSANVVEAVMAGMANVQSEVQLVASSGGDRVASISPSSFSDVAGQTVNFTVQFTGCTDCSADATDSVVLRSPLYGESAVTLTPYIPACTASVAVVTTKEVSWVGWVQHDRAGPGVSLESLPTFHAGEPDPVRGSVPWWTGTGDVRLQAISEAGVPPTDEPLETAIHIVNGAPGTTVSAVQSITPVFTNVLPITLRGYSKASSVSGASSATDYAVTMSLEYEDGTTETDAAVLEFTSGTHDWEFVSAAFLPSQRVVGATVSAHLRGGAQGEAWFAGVGLIVVPSAACSCERGFYATVSKAVGSGGSVDASAIAGATRCSRCPLGFACSGSSLVVCPTGKFSYGGYSSCQDCLTGRTCINGTIAPCAIGFYLSSNNTCSQCPVGSACTGGLRKICPAGFYAPLPGTEFCLPCLPGTVSNTTETEVCTTCPPGTTSNFGRTACIPCGYGETSTEGQHPCTTCPKGKYASTRGSIQCDDCPVGTYSEFPASRACDTCPGSSTTLAPGANNSTLCVTLEL